jgi:hypothetical protein
MSAWPVASRANHLGSKSDALMPPPIAHRTASQTERKPGPALGRNARACWLQTRPLPAATNETRPRTKDIGSKEWRLCQGWSEAARRLKPKDPPEDDSFWLNRSRPSEAIATSCTSLCHRRGRLRVPICGRLNLTYAAAYVIVS